MVKSPSSAASGISRAPGWTAGPADRTRATVFCHAAQSIRLPQGRQGNAPVPNCGVPRAALVAPGSQACRPTDHTGRKDAQDGRHAIHRRYRSSNNPILKILIILFKKVPENAHAWLLPGFTAGAGQLYRGRTSAGDGWLVKREAGAGVRSPGTVLAAGGLHCARHCLGLRPVTPLCMGANLERRWRR